MCSVCLSKAFKQHYSMVSATWWVTESGLCIWGSLNGLRLLTDTRAFTLKFGDLKFHFLVHILRTYTLIVCSCRDRIQDLWAKFGHIPWPLVWLPHNWSHDQSLTVILKGLTEHLYGIMIWPHSSTAGLHQGWGQFPMLSAVRSTFNGNHKHYYTSWFTSLLLQVCWWIWCM